MDLLLEVLNGLPEYQSLVDCCRRNQTVAVTGAAQINRSHLIAALARQLDRPVVIVCQDDMAAARTAAELQAFLGGPVETLPTRDLTLYDATVVSRQWEQQRLRQLYDLAQGRTRVQIMSAEAAVLRTVPQAQLQAAAITLHCGMQLEPAALARRLLASGYTRGSLVEGVGQFAMRGGIVDVFSPARDAPVRIEFFGDEVDTMGQFDAQTQRRTENLEALTILPVAECLPQLHPGGIAGLCADLEALIARQQRRRHPNEALLQTLRQDRERLENGEDLPAADRYMALIYPALATALDYAPEDAIVLLCDHGNIRRAIRQQQDQMGQLLDGLLETGQLAGELCDFYSPWEQLCQSLTPRQTVYLDAFLAASYPEQPAPQKLLTVNAKQLPCYGGSVETAAADLAFYRKERYACLVLCGNRRRGEILHEMLREREIPAILAFPLTQLPPAGTIYLTDGTLPAGMEYAALHLAVLSEGQLLQKKPARRPKAPVKASNRQKLHSFTDLTPGDLVVHTYHGIGRYEGMEQMKLDGVVKDYIKISYQGTDVLYVPATQLDLVSKYIGAGENGAVRLNKLGTDAWEKTKAKAKKSAKDMAAKLIKLYAERKRRPGYAFSPDTPWQAEFEENFAYVETDDQLRCIAEIKQDMQQSTPMDRLLCGDVGFGKTEVALRAAMKAILDSKQVAILVPTTVLARQHYLTAKQRFAGFPVNIESFSRFSTAAQQRQTIAGLRSGAVDLVVGTHKLLQKEIEFKNLGLLIVDEEQRFGVTHKERLKEMSAGVDVLTLSATPIPRTLNMALSGLRDMSTIEQPPQDRYPVQTYVMEYAQPVLDEAMRRELARGGQVYYLHNRVESIEQTAAGIKRRIPEAEVAVGHGKMTQEQLSDVMQRMADGDVQILVCTTIIETGIDIPNVNTLIIEDADHFGLAQLHQLRGRVGRSSRHAFAYLTFRRGKTLSEVAEKRLTAIRDFAAFGSGFKIAMRDLEIRGAGNLLGAEQSGHMMTVGYDMYLQLLEDAVLEEQGEERKKEPVCTADLAVTANIAEAYVPDGEQRMDLYRRMAAVRSRADADDLLDEIVDRYGDPPKGVMNLLAVALLRARAAAAGVADISQKGAELLFTMAEFDFAAVSDLSAEPAWKGRVRMLPKAEKPILAVRLAKAEQPLRLAEQFVDAYRQRHAGIT